MNACTKYKVQTVYKEQILVNVPCIHVRGTGTSVRPIPRGSIDIIICTRTSYIVCLQKVVTSIQYISSHVPEQNSFHIIDDTTQNTKYTSNSTISFSSISSEKNHCSSSQFQTMTAAATNTTTTTCNNFIDNEFTKGSIDASSYIPVLNPCNGNEIGRAVS